MRSNSCSPLRCLGPTIVDVRRLGVMPPGVSAPEESMVLADALEPRRIGSALSLRVRASRGALFAGALLALGSVRGRRGRAPGGAPDRAPRRARRDVPRPGPLEADGVRLRRGRRERGWAGGLPAPQAGHRGGLRGRDPPRVRLARPWPPAPTMPEVKSRSSVLRRSRARFEPSTSSRRAAPPATSTGTGSTTCSSGGGPGRPKVGRTPSSARASCTSSTVPPIFPPRSRWTRRRRACGSCSSPRRSPPGQCSRATLRRAAT